MGKRVGMEVSLAIAEAAKMADVDVVAAYPITPQTHIVERMAELGVFTKIAHSNEGAIVELKNEVNALLIRLGEKLKYDNSAKQP